MVETTKGSHGTMRKPNTTGSRPIAPWMPVNKNDTARRYSAATIRIEKSPVFIEDMPKNSTVREEKKSKMKKSETFYARFVKNVLSPSRRHSNSNKEK
jgi:hypothetical protein